MKTVRDRKREGTVMDRGMKKRTGAAAGMIGIVLGIAALLGVQCGRYFRQNMDLQKMLAAQEEAAAVYEEEISRLQARLAEISETEKTEETETEIGFLKKGGTYLIDSSSQLEELAAMIEEKEEVEPGVLASEASYRLRADLEMPDWFCIGTEETPFAGIFDGDGNAVRGKFPFRGSGAECLFYVGENALIENLEVDNDMTLSAAAEVRVSVQSKDECMELERNLETFPDCRIRLGIHAWDLNMDAIAEDLQERWERNQGEENYYISVYFYPEEDEDEAGWKPDMATAMTSFAGLAGERWDGEVTEIIKQEGGYLRYIGLKHMEGLNYCIVETGALDHFRRNNAGYHLFLEGKWEGKNVPPQHIYIPYTDMGWLGYGGDGLVTAEDINFDGRNDLLIHEGYSGGSGGSWNNYRAVIWNDEKGLFEFYPSFPEQLVSLEFDRQRVVTRYRLGFAYECVEEYGVVDGEYVCTRKLALEAKPGETDWIFVLSYYEMEKLVETVDVTDMGVEEIGALYPDLDYWSKG